MTKLYEILDEKGVACRDEMGRFEVLRPGQFITDKMIEAGMFNQGGLDHMVSSGRIRHVKDLGAEPLQNKMMPKSNKKDDKRGESDGK